MTVKIRGKKTCEISKDLNNGSKRAVNFVDLLQCYAKTKDLNGGIQAHATLLKRALPERSSYLANSLLVMYVRCGALPKAHNLLTELPKRTLVGWTTLINGYTVLGKAEKALKLFELMRADGIFPNAVTFTCVLKACGISGATAMGEQIHHEVTRLGLLADNVILGNAVLDMYTKCGALQKAEEFLDRMHTRDVISWTTAIAGYVQHGKCKEALKCHISMQGDGILPNTATYICLLKAFAGLGAIEIGEEIHHEVARQCLLGKDIALGSALVDMYAKCGALVKAEQVLQELSLKEVVSWTALIGGYVEHGQHEDALLCFQRMQDKGVTPNAVTYACILSACGKLGDIGRGAEIHDQIKRYGLLKNNDVLGCALLNMYAKCGDLAIAKKVFEELPAKGVVAWTTLITGYVQHNHDREAIICFKQMNDEGVFPNAMTLASVLKACGNLGAMKEGEEIHDIAVQHGLVKEDDRALCNALVDMYVKCGALTKARKLLDELPDHDVVCWALLIAGYIRQGHSRDAFDCFEEMLQHRLTPNEVIMSSILSVCSHLGLIEEGQMYFENMVPKYGIKPNVEHYMCMIDLYGRSGLLDKAVALIKSMPAYENSVVWHTLLGACQKWRDVNTGRWAFDQAIQLDEMDNSAYVLMANIYIAAGLQEEADHIENLRLSVKTK